MLVCTLECSPNKGEPSPPPIPACKPRILNCFGYGTSQGPEGLFSFLNVLIRSLGLSMIVCSKECQAVKERVPGCGGRAGYGESRHGSGKGTDSYEAGKYRF